MQCNSIICSRRHSKKGADNADKLKCQFAQPKYDAKFEPPAAPGDGAAQQFIGQHDEEGVYVYQAFNDEIADNLVARSDFLIKPSFAWVLYRAGYARKHNQTRILKIKVS